MDRFTERTAREEVESLPTCWKCGDPCDELTQAPWTTKRLLIGTCCQPEGERDEECTCSFAGDQADASGCYAHGDMPGSRAVELLAMLQDAGATATEISAYLACVGQAA